MITHFLGSSSGATVISGITTVTGNPESVQVSVIDNRRRKSTVNDYQ